MIYLPTQEELMTVASSTNSRNRTNTKTFNPEEYRGPITTRTTGEYAVVSASVSHTYTYTIDEQIQILKTFRQVRPVYIYNFETKTWSILDPDSLIQFDFCNCLYSIAQAKPTGVQRPVRNNSDFKVFPELHVQYHRIVYDSVACEYYDRQNDIFLTEDDIKFYGLRPYSAITSPLPDPLPENYWDAPPE